MAIIPGNPPVTKIATAGTLGDAFIILCKLYGRHKNTGERFQVIRFSSHPQMDGVIEALYSTVSFVEYITPCRVTMGYDELKRNLSALPYDYINSTWDGKEDIGLKTEPEGFPMECYPELDVPAVEVKSTKFNLGIQLHCGSDNVNCRGFSLRWLGNIRKHFPLEKYDIYLFGTGAPSYPPSSVEDVCRKAEIINKVGQLTFNEWLSYMRSMNVFISFEGFSALFAMSQKVKTLLYNQYPYGIDRTMHPAWYENNMVVQLNRNKVLRKLRAVVCKHNLYSPSTVFIDKFLKREID